MLDACIPVIVVDDTPIKRRGLCEFVAETSCLQLMGQADTIESTLALLASIQSQPPFHPNLPGWLVLSDLRLGPENGIQLGRTLLEQAPDLRVVIYTQDPSWTLAAEIFRQEYLPQGKNRRYSKRDKKSPALHGYALFKNMEPGYLDKLASTVIVQKDIFIDPDVLQHLLTRLRGQRLTPRQEECAAFISQGLSNEDVARHMGFLTLQGFPNTGPVENLVSELYAFFAIEGAPGDPGRRVLLAHAYEAYIGQRL